MTNILNAMMNNIHGLWLQAKHACKKQKSVLLLLLYFQARSAKRSYNLDESESSQQSLLGNRIHILVVNSFYYVLLAQICINSFLKYNPHFNFVIHTDSRLVKLLRRRFKSLIKFNRVEVIEDLDQALTWQRSKLGVILAMNGTNDIFMDADLRWNGPLIETKGITFYLREFSLGSSALYTNAFPNYGLAPDHHMYNLSFFTFGGYVLSVSDIDEVLSLQQEIEQLVSESLAPSDILAIRRMSEQLALSIAVCRFSASVSTLKSADQRSDGDFVESCYFGATGLTF
jgi:hypothetical protein